MPIINDIDMRKHFKWGDFVSFEDLQGQTKVGFIIEDASGFPEYDILAEGEPDTYRDVWDVRVKPITNRQLDDPEFIEAHPFAMKVYNLQRQNEKLMVKVWESMPRQMPEATHPLWRLFDALAKTGHALPHVRKQTLLDELEERIKAGEKLYEEYMRWCDELWDSFGPIVF